MSKTFYYILQSPKAFFNEAAKLRLSMLNNDSYGAYVLRSMLISKDGEFHGSWEKTIRTFNESSFETTASLTDQIVNDLTTASFNEVKWKYLTHLEEGDEVDVGRFLSGHERCWNGTRRRTRTRHAVRIYLNTGGNSFRSFKELAVSGAIGITFAEIMESMGLSAEIWAVYCDARGDVCENNYIHLVRLKQQNEYADMVLINWFLGNNGVFRNAQFRIHILHAHQNGFDVPRGMGTSVSADLDNLGLTASEKQSAIVVPQIYSISSAKSWLNTVLSDQELLHRLIYAEDIEEE